VLREASVLLRGFIARTGLHSRRVYTSVISLGGSCRPAHQINRHFVFKQSFPFSGWIAPLDSAARFVEELDGDLYRSEDLREIRDPRGIVAIENTRFQITLYHDFKRLKDNSEFKPMLPDWREQIAHARSRTKYLIDKLKALNNASSRLLFVRYLDDISPPGLSAGVTGQEATERLLRALCARFDRATFDLMCIDFGSPLTNPDPRLIYCAVHDEATVWQGTDRLWSQAFDQIGARLQPSQLDRQQQRKKKQKQRRAINPHAP
jgi:hypothetical protein